MEYRIKQVGNRFYPQYKQKYWVWCYIKDFTYIHERGFIKTNHFLNDLVSANKYMKDYIHENTTTIYEVTLDIKDERRKKLEKIQKSSK